MNDSIKQGRALLERAIEQGEGTQLFTDEELPLVIEFLEALSDPADYQENQDTPDVLLVRKLTMRLRRQLADELRRLANEDERERIELGGHVHDLWHELSALQRYRNKSRGGD